MSCYEEILVLLMCLAKEEDLEFTKAQASLDWPCPLSSPSFPSLWPSPFHAFGCCPLP